MLPPNHNMDKPCEICGDIGYASVLRICYKCHITREHPYCMKILHEGGLDDWVCEECYSGGLVPSLNPDKCEQAFRSVAKLGLRNPPRSSKVQYITPEEAKVLESGAPKKKLSSPCKSIRPWKSTHSRASPKAKQSLVVQKQQGRQELLTKNTLASIAIAEKEKYKGPTPQLWRESPTAKPSRPNQIQEVNAGSRKLDSLHTSQGLVQGLPAKSSNIGPMQRRSKETSAGKTLPLETIYKLDAAKNFKSLGDACVPSVQQLPTSSSVPCVDAQPKEPAPYGKDSLEDVLEFDRYLLNHPAKSPTWKGRFDIAHEDFQHRSFDGIQAHPPCKVHRKVYDLSTKLPEALQFEVLPRLSFWVKLFEDDIPGPLDIGLFFFCARRPEQSYTSLLDCLDSQDMLLRSQIDGVELLVFSSKHLAEDSQRINQNMYLWGVFHSCDVNAVASEAVSVSGGYELARIDKVLPPPDASTDPWDRDRCSPRGEDPTKSFLEDQLEFERQLQTSFDRFIKLKRSTELIVSREVKEEPRSPRS